MTLDHRREPAWSLGGRARLTRPGRLVGVVAALGLLSSPCGAAATPPSSATVPARGIVDIRTRLAFENYAVAGTGIVLSSRGEILTNNHVIRGATSIRVRDVNNDKSYGARVVGYDVVADIAVLQLSDATGLQPAKLGDSARLRRGDPVTAVGNALGAGGAPRSTSGKVVALHRGFVEVFDDGGIQLLSGLIDVDAALLPGDSGGPLLDAAGRVVGVDTLGSAIPGLKPLDLKGEGAAVPIDTALSIAAAVEARRSSPAIHIGATAFLGLDFQFSAVYSGLTPGVTVVRVVRGSPAARAGLKPGDVVSSCDGVTVTAAQGLSSLLFAKRPGDKISLGWSDITGNPHSATLTATSGPAL